MTRLRAAGALVLLGLGAGCLGEPEIEDRWTRIDVHTSTLEAGETVVPGAPMELRAAGEVTFRSILTGFCVAEVRVSPTLAPDALLLDPDMAREDLAHEIDILLDNSVTAGRATRAMTGWDHLIFPFDLTFDANVPAATDSGATESAFLVVYLGEGNEIRLEDGRDSLVVIPFRSDEHEVLPMAVPLTLASSGGRSR